MAELTDKVRGLDLGADDFAGSSRSSSPELLADPLAAAPPRPGTDAGRPAGRRPGGWTPAATGPSAAGCLQPDDKEFALLHLLMRRNGDVITRTQIISLIWDMNFDNDSNVVEVAICRLRAKIDDGFDLKPDPYHSRRRLRPGSAPMTPPGRLSLRLALLVGALGALLALALGAMAHWNLGRELEAAGNLQLKLEQIRHSLEDDLDLRDPAVRAHALQDQLVAHSGLHLSILDSRSGQPLMSFGDLGAASVAANRALLAQQADARQPVFQSWSTGNDQRLLSIGASMRMKNGTPVQVLLSSGRRRRAPARRFPPRHPAGPALPPATDRLAAWWVVRAGLEPLNRFRRSGRPGQPAGISTLPSPSRTCRASWTAWPAASTTCSAASGWRTPALAVFRRPGPRTARAPICNLLVRNQVLLSQHRDSAAYREALESNAEELERLSRIVTDMLFLVQVDNPAIQAQFGCVACTSRRPRSSTCTRWSPRTRTSTCANPTWLRPRRTSLIDPARHFQPGVRAVRHTPQGGRIDVRIGERAGHTEVVSNDGPGIPPNCLPHPVRALLPPRRTPDWAQAGTGLGLAIVQSIMATTAAAPKRKPQQKTHLRLLFPSTGAA